MQIYELLAFIETIAPPALQENYDNSGLIIGDAQTEITGVLITLDITSEILEEAIAKNCNLIIAHHPLIFQGVKKITPKDTSGKLIIRAIQSNVAIYAAHTNLDNILGGVNGILAKKLGLQNIKILSPLENRLRKLVTFCPSEYEEKVRTALFEAGAGQIGNYDCCSYNTSGYGTFRALENANPYVGEISKLHLENEVRIEIIYPDYLEQKIIKALTEAHPYEEVAYDCIQLQNTLPTAGAGIIGELPEACNVGFFLNEVKRITQIPVIKHSALPEKEIKRIALCGGSGSFLIETARRNNADIFLTGDLKYHDFQKASENLIIADIGHYESEQFAKELIYSLISKKFTTFAVLVSEHTTNYVRYL